ncbi:MAG TPA: D-alanyl-D-alanine carboxypeptidase family protein [Xanthobacteraceae bacterium]|jgi:D-alanyl-D-alanine carboxypeptidase (penicillin-binding protein 5/6)|nr:D-alanyl-D-alanine carboxypeptidase family protein [Xanthobacteraceae bacterium]
MAAAFLALVLAGAQAAPVAPAKKDEGGFQTSLPAALVLDPESNSVLFEKNGDEQVEPASLAKLMTLEYVFNEIKQGRAKLDDEYIISENAWRKGGAPSHGSTMFAAIHSRVKLSDLIQGIIVDSANDACIAIAEAMAGNERSFGAALTKRAREIGLENSTFVNSTGFSDPLMRVTVRDMAELARYIMRTYPDFYPYFSEREYTWNNIRQQNRNPLLGMGLGADGLKTGETGESSFNLVGSAVQDNFRLIVVITGAKTDAERANEAKKLLDLGFHGFEAKVVFAEGQTIGDVKVFGGDQSYVPLVAPGTIKVMMPKNGTDRLIARIVYTGPIPAPVVKGQTVATLKVWRGESLALEAPLQAADDVGPGNMRQRAMDGATELMIGMFRAGVGKL